MPHAIGIFSLKDDLHALAVQHALRNQPGTTCHVFETNDFVHAGCLTWSIDGDASVAPPSLRDREGKLVDPRALDLIWWRRVGFPQRDHVALDDASDKAIIDNEWRYALHGTLANEFTGEASPQGQFLFAHGMTGVDLIGPFVSFLLREAGTTRSANNSHARFAPELVMASAPVAPNWDVVRENRRLGAELPSFGAVPRNYAGP